MTMMFDIRRMQVSQLLWVNFAAPTKRTNLQHLQSASQCRQLYTLVEQLYR